MSLLSSGINSKTDEEIINFIALKNPRTKDVVVWMNAKERIVDIRLCALKLAGKISQKNENSPWFSKEQVKEKKPSKITDEQIVEYIEKYKPLTADIADWMGVCFLTASRRLECMSEKGLIIRLRRKNAWYVRLKPIEEKELEDTSLEKCGRLIFDRDDKNNLLVKVLPNQSKVPLNSDEITKILEMTSSTVT